MDAKAAGHRAVPHTADVRVEAWAPTREACLAEAVAAAVETFAQVTGEPERLHLARLEAADDAELLVVVLDEVVFVLETVGAVPVRATLRPVPGGAELELGLVDIGRAHQVGAVPKGVSRHELRVEHGPQGWWCTAILDV